jgi:glycosyltransferase involved in cell wall biosynthesis
MSVTVRAVLTFLGLKLIIASVNLVTFPRLRPGRRTDLEDVSILIPARDEAHNLVATLPTVVDQQAGEVLVLDDASTDATPRTAASVPGVEVLTGAPLPPGWLGKPWACQQLADRARGRWLVFTDADVHWGPGALAGLRDELDRHAAPVGSVFASQRTGTFGERLTVTLIDDVLLSFLPHPLVHAEISASAVAVSGGVLAFRRDVYDRIGGHATVRDRIVEDVALGRAARRSGVEVAVALGAGVVHLRMYRGYREVIAGFGKNLRAAHGGSRALIAADVAWHLLAYSLPVVLAPRHGAWRLALIVGITGRTVVSITAGRPVAEALLTPLQPIAALPVAARAMARHQRWKGRDLEAGR